METTTSTTPTAKQPRNPMPLNGVDTPTLFATIGAGEQDSRHTAARVAEEVHRGDAMDDFRPRLHRSPHE